MPKMILAVLYSGTIIVYIKVLHVEENCYIKFVFDLSYKI